MSGTDARPEFLRAIRGSDAVGSVVDGQPIAAREGRTDPTKVLCLTEVLWGIRWSDHLPRSVGDGVLVVPSSYDEAMPFIEAHFAAIFEDEGEGRFSQRSASGARTRYYRTVGDFFEFRQGDRTVALMIGTAQDWSTYFIRSLAALPGGPGQNAIRPFYYQLLEILRAAGVERVEADTSPSNLAMLQLFTRLRFNPSGTVLTDRWGAQLRFTKFLDTSAEEVFLNQFCTGVRYQRRAHPGRTPGMVKGETT